MKKVLLSRFVLALSLYASFGVAAPIHAKSNPSSSAKENTKTLNGSDANSLKAQKVEKLALEIFKTPAVQEAIAKGLKSYRESQMSTKPDGIKFAQSAIDEVATMASLYAAMSTIPDPVFVWVDAPPHKWNGYSILGSRWFGDNVDTFYRTVRVDDQSNYEITIKIDKTMPAQLSFQIYNWLMYETGTTARNDIPLGTLEITDATPRNADGTITLTAGPAPANGRANYIQLKPGAKQIFVREIRGDWSLQPVQLSVKRTKGAVPKNKTIEEMSKEAAILISAGVVATNNVTLVFGELTENQLAPVRVRWIEELDSKVQELSTEDLIGPDKAVGFLSSGLFNLKKDEALILTLNTMGTKYVSINTYRPFILSPESVYSSSSLNNFQTKANPDGSITFVLARNDPGVYNWLDVSGIPYGYIAVRWQTLTHPVSGTLKNGVKLVKVVKLSDLHKELPSTTKWVTAKERSEQRTNRAKQYRLKCMGTPCEVGGELDRMY